MVSDEANYRDAVLPSTLQGQNCRNTEPKTEESLKENRAKTELNPNILNEKQS